MSRQGNRDRRARAVKATTATAGTPATLAPAFSRGGNTLADMTGVTASPGTAWVGTEHVPLQQGGAAKWNGTAWVAYP